MQSLATLLLVVGTAAVTATVMGLLFARPQRPEPPQVVYIPVMPPPQESGSGCLPLVILVLVILGALAFL